MGAHTYTCWVRSAIPKKHPGITLGNPPERSEQGARAPQNVERCVFVSANLESGRLYEYRAIIYTYCSSDCLIACLVLVKQSRSRLVGARFPYLAVTTLSDCALELRLCIAFSLLLDSHLRRKSLGPKHFVTHSPLSPRARKHLLDGSSCGDVHAEVTQTHGNGNSAPSLSCSLARLVVYGG